MEQTAARVGSKVNETRFDRIFNVVVYVLLALMLIVVIYPLYFVLLASVSDPQYVNSGTPLLYPRGFTLMGYRQLYFLLRGAGHADGQHRGGAVRHERFFPEPSVQETDGLQYFRLHLHLQDEPCLRPAAVHRPDRGGDRPEGGVQPVYLLRASVQAPEGAHAYGLPGRMAKGT